MKPLMNTDERRSVFICVHLWFRSHLWFGSGENVLDWLAEVDLQTLVPGNLGLARVEAELAQHGRVDVGDVVAVLDGVEAQLVRRSVRQSSLDAGAGHPAGEAERVMIAAASRALDPRRTAEFRPPDHD